MVSGAGYGIRQAHIAGAFAIEVPHSIDFTLIDAAIASSTGGLMYEPPKNDEDHARALASRVALWVSAIQRTSRIPVSRQYATLPPVPRPDGGVTVPVFMDIYSDNALKIALQFVTTAINALLKGTFRPQVSAADLAVHSDELVNKLQSYGPAGVDNFYLLCAADELDIPVRHYVGGIYGLGTGRHLQWFHQTATEQTRLIGSMAARSKRFTHLYLARFGLPVAKGGIARTEDEAVRIAKKIGFPVVIKPEDLDNGRGIAAGIRTELVLRKSWQIARGLSGCIIVEKHHFGGDYRLTVNNDEVVAVMRRTAWGITGNGFDTIEELARKNLPSVTSRKLHRRPEKIAVNLDEEALGILEEVGLSPLSVLPKGKHQVLRRKANVSVGGTQEAVSIANVHPENLALAVRAARLMRLDVAGIDLIIEDIGQAWHEQDAIICEVNAIPQVGGRICPDFHKSLIQGIIGKCPRVPVHVVFARSHAMPPEDVIIDVARRLECNAVSTGIAIYIDDKPIAAKLENSSDAAIAVIDDTQTEAALVVLDVDELSQRGLPCDRFETASFWRSDDGQIWGDFDPADFGAMITPHIKNFSMPGAAKVV